MKISTGILYATICCLGAFHFYPTSGTNKSVLKNGMSVKWDYKNNRIFFEMSAPTSGWITIGFNESPQMKGTYLIMGNVVNGTAQVVEHYTISEGNYKPIQELGGAVLVEDIEGDDRGIYTTIRFSLPISSIQTYQRTLNEGSQYHMIMAYSREDDFQHHSIMRTSININL